MARLRQEIGRGTPDLGRLIRFTHQREFFCGDIRQIVASDQHHRQLGIELAQFAGEIEPVHLAGHHDVANHQIKRCRLCCGKRGARASCMGDVITKLQEH